MPDSRDKPSTTWLIDSLFGILLERRSVAQQALIAVCALAAALVLRFASNDFLPPGFPFITFFPAVIAVGVFASVGAGALVAAAAGFLSLFFFIPPYGFNFDSASLVAMGFYTFVTGFELFFIWIAKTALHRAHTERNQSAMLAESRDLMFSELQHRVSNNLAVMSALLRMQAEKTPDHGSRQALLNAMQRLNTVSLIQRGLYSPDMQLVDTRSFLGKLAQDTVQAYATAVTPELHLAVDSIELDREQAVPFGLIASELIMNALEHATPTNGKLRIDVTCTLEPRPGQDSDIIAMTVRDDGEGLPESFRLSEARSLGSTIMVQFARQIGGTLTLSNADLGRGTVGELRFPRR